MQDADPSNFNSDSLASSHSNHRQKILSSRLEPSPEPQQTRTHQIPKSIADTTSTTSRPGKGLPVSASSKQRNDKRRVVSIDVGNGTLESNANEGMHTTRMGQRLTESAWTRPEDFLDEYGLSHEGKQLPVQLRCYSHLSGTDPRILQDVQRALKLKHRHEIRAKSLQLDSSLHKAPFSPPASPFCPNSTPATRSKATEMAADIDFSPSTSFAMLNVDLHPVPSSVDDGDTLDWSDNERRKWTLSVSKKKDRDKDSIHSAGDMRIQDEITEAKLAGIKTFSSQLTVKKAAITNDQLSRRYNLVYRSLSPGSDRFSLLKVSRWYSEQEPTMRSSLEKAEPFPWLKHLDKRKSGQESVRMPWHLSALIMEEYLRAQNAHNRAIKWNDASEEFRPSSETSLSRNVFEEGVSFEPFLETWSSNESQTSIDSMPSSTGSQILKDPYRAGFSFRRSGIGRESEGSPTRNSIAEKSKDNKEQAIWRLRDMESVEIESSEADDSEDDDPSVHGEDPLRSTVIPSATANVTVPTEFGKGMQSAAEFPSALVSSEDRLTFALKQQQQRKAEADEQRVDMEYVLKSQLVAQCKDSNVHVRTVLNRIVQLIREFDMCQSSFVTGTLGLSYEGGLSDLIDALSHDPANVTSSTKRLKTYKAVDDIHYRLMRQRAVLREFLEVNSSSGGRTRGSPVTEDIDPIESLMRSLKMLEEQRMSIVKKEEEASELLKRTQVLHMGVKADYNDTLARTSLVYPEINEIVGLRESYKAQNQHLWDLGMNTLTFILNTVTPFWRTHGKRIADDVHAFLIVPLYRNEFTGEAKWYPIAHLPQRTIQHWLALMMVFFLTIGMLLIQTPVAVLCSVNYTLGWIPYRYNQVRWAALPFFWVGIVIQWLVILCELVILMMQIGTFLWWVGWSIGLVA